MKRKKRGQSAFFSSLVRCPAKLLSDELELEGSKLDLAKFFSLIDKPEGRFDIVTP